MNPDLTYKPRNVVAEFIDDYGDKRIVHRPKGRGVRVAKIGDTPTHIFNRAVAILTAARIKARRAAIGIRPAAVNQWERVPHERCLELERLTEGRVTRYQMRPDIYGEPPAEAA